MIFILCAFTVMLIPVANMGLHFLPSVTKRTGIDLKLLCPNNNISLFCFVAKLLRNKTNCHQMYVSAKPFYDFKDA